MTSETRQADIRSLLLEKIRAVRYGRCARRAGLVLAATGYAVFEFYTEVPPTFISHWPWIGWLYSPSAVWVTSAALAISIFGAILFIAGFITTFSGALFKTTTDTLWAKYIGFKKLFPLDLPPNELADLIFKFGDRANPGSFVRMQTLSWLLAVDAGYICGWGGGATHAKRNPQTICFFVLAPLSRAGVRAMETGSLKKNRDLLPEHVARSFGRSCGLYIIEVFGSTFFQKGAILYLLQKQLERKLAKKLFGRDYALFTRPVNEFGYRQVKRFGFENLGSSIYEMHRWRALPSAGICGS